MGKHKELLETGKYLPIIAAVALLFGVFIGAILGAIFF